MPVDLPSRTQVIDFVAAVAVRHRVQGPTIRRLLRLVDRYRKGVDEGPALESLHAAIANTLPRAEITFFGRDVFVDDNEVP